MKFRPKIDVKSFFYHFVLDQVAADVEAQQIENIEDITSNFRLDKIERFKTRLEAAYLRCQAAAEGIDMPNLVDEKCRNYQNHINFVSFCNIYSIISSISLIITQNFELGRCDQRNANRTISRGKAPEHLRVFSACQNR